MTPDVTMMPLEWADPSSSPERELEKRQAAEELDILLGKLNIEQRVVFTMFELEGLSCDAISESLGVPVGTVYSRLHRGRRTFLRALTRRRAAQRSIRRGSAEGS